MGRRLLASSQNQALNALVFLYRHVLENTIPQDHLGKFLLLRSPRARRVPTVLSPDEVRSISEAIPPARIYRLMVELLYGTGMRVSEVCTLRRCGASAAEPHASSAGDELQRTERRHFKPPRDAGKCRFWRRNEG
jgi:site-specific recombinase XerD